VTTVGIYVRISRDPDGSEAGVQRQEKDSRELASRRGWTIGEVYRENDTSAFRRRVVTLPDGRRASRVVRPEFRRLLDDLDAGRIGGFVAYDLDRVARDPRDLEDLIDLKESRNVVIETVTGSLRLENDSDITQARVMVAIANKSSRDTARRVRDAARHRREQGHFHGGWNVPYGYRAIREEGQRARLVPEPKHAKLLNEAADRLLAGDSLYGICSDWNARGHTTGTGAFWRSKTLKFALLNVAVLGQTKAAVQGWEPIIDQTTYDRLHALLTDPVRMTFQATSKSYEGKHTMSGGLTVCAVCGKNLVGQTHRGKARLICHKQATGGCGSVTIDHAHLESYVFEQVLSALKTSDRFQQRMAEPIEHNRAELTALEANLRDLNEQAARANSAFVKGFMKEAEYGALMRQVIKEREAAEVRQSELLRANVMTAATEDGFDWKSWPPLRRRNFLRQLVARVEVQRWPAGLASTLTRRSGESEAAHRQRVEANRREALERRVRIVPR
jgi:site-specific DNA recombinase